MENWRRYLLESSPEIRKDLAAQGLQISDEEEAKELARKSLDKFQGVLDSGSDGFSDYEMVGYEMNQWLENNKDTLDKEIRFVVVKGKFVMDEVASRAFSRNMDELGRDGMEDVLDELGHDRGMEYYDAFVSWVES